ncbi:MAG: hypothetical protein ACM336_09425 [Acidobacteriota bacterium]
MTPILLAILAAVLLFIAGEALRPRYGILQYPFLAASGLLGFVVPQAIGVARAGSAPDAAIARTLVMCILCAAAIHLGWNSRVPPAWLRPPSPIPTRTLYAIAVALIAIGLAAYLKITAMSGGLVAHYSAGGHYSLTWSGMPVVYSFFVQWLEPGFTLATLCALRLRSKFRLAPPAIAGLIFIASVVFLARRTMLVWLCLALPAIAWFARRWAPPRWAALAAVPVLAVAIVLAPYYRRHSPIGSDTGRLAALDPGAGVKAVLDGSDAEFWAMAHVIEITARERLYDYGVGFYNAFVLIYVPKLLVGEDGKRALLADAPSRTAYDSYEWRIPYGMVPGGPATAFAQFWYAGAIVYFFIARWMRFLWVRANETGDVVYQSIYAAGAVYGVTAAVTDMYAIYLPFFQYFLPLAALNEWFRKR